MFTVCQKDGLRTNKQKTCRSADGGFLYSWLARLLMPLNCHKMSQAKLSIELYYEISSKCIKSSIHEIWQNVWFHQNLWAEFWTEVSSLEQSQHERTDSVVCFWTWNPWTGQLRWSLNLKWWSLTDSFLTMGVKWTLGSKMAPIHPNKSY